MSTSPLRGSGSDSDWDKFIPWNQPILETDSSGSESEIDWETLEKSSVNPADVQLQLLQSKETSGELTNKPDARQNLFFSTIFILAGEEKYDQAETLLIEADTKGVWEGYGAQRAKTYLYLIEKILEKGVHEKANALYSRALELSVFEDSFLQGEAAKQALIQAGYHIP